MPNDVNETMDRSAHLRVNRIRHPTEKSVFIEFFTGLSLMLIGFVLFLTFLPIYLFILPLIIMVKWLVFNCRYSSCYSSSSTSSSSSSSSSSPPLSRRTTYTFKRLNLSEDIWAEHCKNSSILQGFILVDGKLRIENIKELLNNQIQSSNTTTTVNTINGGGGDGDTDYNNIPSNTRPSTLSLIPNLKRILIRPSTETRLHHNHHQQPGWKTSTEINLDNHVFKNDKLQMYRSDALYKYLIDLSNEAFNYDLPPWQIHVQEDPEQDGKTILLFRCHAALMDGVNLMEAFIEIFNDSKIVYLKRRYGQVGRYASLLRSLVLCPLYLLRNCLLIDGDYNCFHRSFNGNIDDSGSGSSSSSSNANKRKNKNEKNVYNKSIELACSEPFSLDIVIRMKLITRSTINDILLCAASGAIRREMLTIDKNIDGSSGIGGGNPTVISATVPIDVRRSRENATSWVQIDLPTNVEGCIPRLWKVKKSMANIKYSSFAQLSYFSNSLLRHLLPRTAFHYIVSKWFRKSSCIISNVPGLMERVTVQNRPVRLLVGWTPIISQIPFTITFTVYHDAVRMTVLVNEKCVANPKRICSYFVGELNMLWKLLCHRKIPGERRPSSSFHHAQQHQNKIIFRWYKQQTIEELRAEVLQVQKHLQDIKNEEDGEGGKRRRLEGIGAEELENKIQLLKNQFRDLIYELKRRRRNIGREYMDGDDESDDEDLEDDEEMMNEENTEFSGGRRSSSFKRARAQSAVSKHSVISLMSGNRQSNN